MTGILLNLRFKGERDYLQGADLFDETVKCAQAEFKEDKLTDIDFSIRHMARSQVKMLMGPPPADVELTGTCTFSTTQGRQQAYLVETGQPVAERHPFPEDELMRSMKIDQIARRGTLFKTTSFTDAEVWVSMTKNLHYKIFPELTGKWIFVRGRIASYAHRTPAATWEIAISSCFNNKFTRNEVLRDGVKVGDIYFSLV